MVKGAFIIPLAFLFQPAWIQAVDAENPLTRMKNAALSRVSAAQQKMTAPSSNSARKSGAAKEIRDKWGVFVGVSQYQDPAVIPMKFAFRNTTALVDVFKNIGIGRFAPDHVVAIANQAASKESIEHTLTDEWLCKKALPEDLVVIYICTRFAESRSGKDVMLLAHDTKLESAASDGIPLSDLLMNVKRRLQSKRIVALLDLSPVVYQKGASPALGGGLNIEQIAEKSGVTILSATRGLERSQRSSTAPISSFTQFLVEEMTNSMGTEPLMGIAEHVIEGVSKEAAHVYGKEQTPGFVAAADSANITEVPLGVRLKSSIPPKSAHIGHPLDQLSMRRPDIMAGTPGRMIRSRTLIAANIPPADLSLAQGSAPAPKQAKETTAEPQAKPAAAKSLAKEAAEGDENDDSAPQKVDMGPYIKEMKRQIQSKWTPPKGMLEKRVVSVFSIRRNGNIEDPTIVESSGTEAVDQSALAALKAASPLPKLPAGAPQFIQIRYQFDWKVKPSAGQASSPAQ